uniref:(northern house mosquito) hypothetical protein n=1 Tax=Culex pipiens TaxID=7175 RepID=A0A8D8JRC4_CULPI
MSVCEKCFFKQAFFILKFAQICSNNDQYRVVVITFFLFVYFFSVDSFLFNHVTCHLRLFCFVFKYFFTSLYHVSYFNIYTFFVGIFLFCLGLRFYFTFVFFFFFKELMRISRELFRLVL